MKSYSCEIDHGVRFVHDADVKSSDMFSRISVVYFSHVSVVMFFSKSVPWICSALLSGIRSRSGSASMRDR